MKLNHQQSESVEQITLERVERLRQNARSLWGNDQLAASIRADLLEQQFLAAPGDTPVQSVRGRTVTGFSLSRLAGLRPTPLTA